MGTEELVAEDLLEEVMVGIIVTRWVRKNVRVRRVQAPLLPAIATLSELPGMALENCR